MGLDPEVELLKRCRRGDAGAWDQLFDLHYAAALRFIYQLSHDFTLEDAEEICQETFLAVIRNLDSFDGRSQFQTWLFRIADDCLELYQLEEVDTGVLHPDLGEARTGC